MANPGCQLPLQMLRGQKHPVLHLIRFASLLHAQILKDQTNDNKLGPRAVRIGIGVVAYKKFFMTCTINQSNPYKLGSVIDTVSYWSDPAYFPYRKGQKREFWACLEVLKPRKSFKSVLLIYQSFMIVTNGKMLSVKSTVVPCSQVLMQDNRFCRPKKQMKLTQCQEQC